MAEIVGLIGHRMGGRPGEHLMHRLGMPVSLARLHRNTVRANFRLVEPNKVQNRQCVIQHRRMTLSE